MKLIQLFMKNWKKVTAVLFTLIVGPLLVHSIYDEYSQWRNQPGLSIGMSIAVYEKGFILQNQTKTCYSEMRNIVTNCQLYRAYVKLPRGRSECPEPGGWLLLKFRIENISSISITNIRVGITGMGMRFETLSFTPNIEALLNYEVTSNDAASTHVVVIKSIAPKDKAILSLKRPIVRNEYYDLMRKKRFSILIPFIISDQFKAKLSNQEFAKINLTEMLKQEVELFTGERVFPYEKIEYRLLKPEEPDVNEKEIDFEPLPPSKKCPEGTAGDW